MSIDALKDRLPEYARDLKLNLSSLASEQLLDAAAEGRQLHRCRAAPPTTRRPRKPWSTRSAPELSPEALNAAKIAASLMAMNNIYYRFVHLVHAADYKTLPAKLRMTAMAKPGVDKVDFELWSLVVSAINGCGMCLEAHEKVLPRARPLGRADPGRGAHRRDGPCRRPHAWRRKKPRASRWRRRPDHRLASAGKEGNDSGVGVFARPAGAPLIALRIHHKTTYRYHRAGEARAAPADAASAREPRPSPGLERRHA